MINKDFVYSSNFSWGFSFFKARKAAYYYVLTGYGSENGKESGAETCAKSPKRLEKRRYGAFNVTRLSRRHIDFIVRQYNQSTMGRRGMNWRALPRCLPLKYAWYFRVLLPCRTGKFPPLRSELFAFNARSRPCGAQLKTYRACILRPRSKADAAGS